MDFALTEDQQIFQRMVRDFATNEIEPVAAQVDEEEKFPAENVRKMAELGLMGVSIAEEYGGSGGDSMHLVIATEEIARACASTSTIFLASLSLACYPIYLFGTEEQKRRFVVPVAKGQKLACFALTEPGAGSDAAAIQTTATLRGDHYVLDGTKTFITNGAEADIAVVFATADKSLRHKGIVALMVEKGTPGFSVGKKERKLGVRGSSTAELVFQSCQVPVGNRLGEEGGGFKVAMGAIDASRQIIADRNFWFVGREALAVDEPDAHRIFERKLDGAREGGPALLEVGEAVIGQVIGQLGKLFNRCVGLPEG